MNININSRGKSGGNKTTKGATSKVGGIVGKVGSLAAKFGNLIPGVGGIVSTVGKMVSKNDPEWWRHHAVQGVTTNIPLQQTDHQIVSGAYASKDGEVGSPINVTAVNLRPAVLEFAAADRFPAVATGPFYPKLLDRDTVINPTREQASTYILQNVRKVVNAIPLQSVEAYMQVLQVNATAYALRHQLDKWIFMSKHNAPYMPSMMDGSFSLLAPANYSTLVALRDRLSQHLSASVRLPHTLCCYLAWRFGRMYRSSNDAKAAFVSYDVLAVDTPIAQVEWMVSKLIGFSAGSDSLNTYTLTNGELNAAQADLYNAYIKHDQSVIINDETQCMFDAKEFVLRTNCDIVSEKAANFGEVLLDQIFMDSSLDNPTTFIASTTSTAYRTSGDTTTQLPLFPIRTVSALFYTDFNTAYALNEAASVSVDSVRVGPIVQPGTPIISNSLETYAPSKGWNRMDIFRFIGATFSPLILEMGDFPTPTNGWFAPMLCSMFAKALEYYNVEIYGAFAWDVVVIEGTNHLVPVKAIDLTTSSYDMALTTGDILKTTQTYAFANLMEDSVTSYSAVLGQQAAAAASTLLSDLKAVTSNAPTVPGTIPVMKAPDLISGS